jgi:hypothetical protein
MLQNLLLVALETQLTPDPLNSSHITTMKAMNNKHTGLNRNSTNGVGLNSAMTIFVAH